jgi:hypothetical protein
MVFSKKVESGCADKAAFFALLQVLHTAAGFGCSGMQIFFWRLALRQSMMGNSFALLYF